MKQEPQVQYLNIVSVSFSIKLMLKDWNYRTHNIDLLNLDENKFACKKNYLSRKRFSEIQKELKKFERRSVSAKKEKIMRKFNSSFPNCRTCKDRWIVWMIQENSIMWNRIAVGDCLTFPVHLQWFQLHSSGLQEYVFGHHFSTFDSFRDHPQWISFDDVQRERGTVLVDGMTETIRASGDRQNQGTIPMLTLGTRPSTMTSTIPVELPQSYMVGQ